MIRRDLSGRAVRSRSERTTLRSGPIRGGAVLIIAMICLLLAGALTVSLVRLTLTGREQIERDEWRLQAVWLAEAGLERAAVQLRRDSAYEGETWMPKSAGGDVLGRVEIVVERENAPTPGTAANVTVIADVPDEPEDRVRVRREVAIGLRSE